MRALYWLKIADHARLNIVQETLLPDVQVLSQRIGLSTMLAAYAGMYDDIRRQIEPLLGRCARTADLSDKFAFEVWNSLSWFVRSDFIDGNAQLHDYGDADGLTLIGGLVIGLRQGKRLQGPGAAVAVQLSMTAGDTWPTAMNATEHAWVTRIVDTTYQNLLLAIERAGYWSLPDRYRKLPETGTDLLLRAQMDADGLTNGEDHA